MGTMKTVTRRDLVKRVAMSGAALTLLEWPNLYGIEDQSGWVKYDGNPVLGGQ